MATLYNQAESNTRKAFFLIFVFLIFVIGLGWGLAYFLNETWILYFAVLFSVIMSFSSYWNSDKIILSRVKAKEVQKTENPELYRIVENLCITVGIPTAKIYIMNEAQPNAFATGRDINHATIVVTQGLLDKLNKRELEGVIAHEISHITGKDILLGSVVVVLVGFVVIVSDILLRATIWGGVSSRNDNNNPFMFILIIIGVILAPIAASIIKLAISRKQEFRADANAALITRDPEGLASALIKISSDGTRLRKIDNSTAHLYISSPIKEKKTSWYEKLFATHPPVEERVKALREGC